MSSLPTWAMWLIAAAALLSPVLAFLLAIAAEIVIGALWDADMLKPPALAAAVAISWSWFRKLWDRPHGRAAVET